MLEVAGLGRVGDGRAVLGRWRTVGLSRQWILSWPEWHSMSESWQPL